MSLIEEALRKQQAQQTSKPGEDKTAAPKLKMAASKAAPVKPAPEETVESAVEEDSAVAEETPVAAEETSADVGSHAKKGLTLRRSDDKPPAPPDADEPLSDAAEPPAEDPAPETAEAPDMTDTPDAPEASEMADEETDEAADPSEAPPKPKGSPLKLMVLLILVLVALGWGGSVLWQSMTAGTDASSPATPRTEADPAPDPEPTPPAVVDEDVAAPVEPVVEAVPAEIPERDPVAQQPDPLPVAPAPTPEPAPDGEPASETALAATPEPGPATDPAPAPDPKPDTSPAPVSPVEPEVEPEPVIWPVLHLTGTLEARGGRQGAAFLNGEVVGVGERFAGVLVLEVVRDGVRLRKDGEDRFLRVGTVLDQ